MDRSAAPMGFRTPPANVDAEQALLGAILVNNRAWHKIATIVRQEDFHEPVHGRIFASIGRLIDAEMVADPVTMARQFDDDETLKEYDGSQYLARIMRSAEALVNVEDYARHIADLALRRGLIRAGEEAVNRAYDPAAPESGREQLEATMASFDNLDVEGRECGWRSLGETLADMVDQIQLEHTIIPTGLDQLDASMAGGLHAGTVYGIEARNKQFKSGTAGTILLSLIRKKVPAIYFALEMGGARIMERLVAAETGTNAIRFRKHYDPDDLVSRLDTFAHKYGREPIYFANEPGIHFDRLRSLARSAVHKLGIRVMFLDYWQLVTGAGRAGQAQHLTDVAQWCAQFAQRHGVAMVIVSQSNREHESYGSDGLVKACDWLARQHKVEHRTAAGDEELVWMEIRANRDGPGHNIGNKECPAFRIDKLGPVLKPYVP